MVVFAEQFRIKCLRSGNDACDVRILSVVRCSCFCFFRLALTAFVTAGGLDAFLVFLGAFTETLGDSRSCFQNMASPMVKWSPTMEKNRLRLFR